MRIPWHWTIAKEAKPNGVISISGSDAGGCRFWATRTTLGGKWQERVQISDRRVVERFYDPENSELRIVDYNEGIAHLYLVARRESSRHIVLERRDAGLLIPLKSDSPSWH